MDCHWMNSASTESTNEAAARPPSAQFLVRLGRGKGTYQSPGNQYLLQVIRWHLPQYIAAMTNKEKTEITSNVVAEIKSAGGRFVCERRESLLQAPMLGEISDAEARVKVCQAIRHMRRCAEKSAGEKRHFSAERTLPNGKSQPGSMSPGRPVSRMRAAETDSSHLFSPVATKAPGLNLGYQIDFSPRPSSIDFSPPQYRPAAGVAVRHNDGDLSDRDRCIASEALCSLSQVITYSPHAEARPQSESFCDDASELSLELDLRSVGSR